MSDTKHAFEKTARTLAKDLIDYAKTEGKAYGISDVEIRLGQSIKTTYAVEEGELATEVTTPEAKGIVVKIFAGDKVLSFKSNSFNADELKSAIKENMQAIHLVPGNPNAALLPSDEVNTDKPVELDLFDETKPDKDALVNYAKTAEAAALAVPGVKTSRNVSVSRTENYSLHIATNGIDEMEAKTLYAASAEIIGEKDGEMEVCYEGSYARHFEDMEDAQTLGTRAGQNAVAQIGAALPNTAEMPVVLSQDAAETFFSSIFSAINGTSLYNGTTFWADKLGKSVTSSDVTLVDDPHVPRGLSSSDSDSTGQKSEKIVFVKDGVLKQFIFNLNSARKNGVDPIGRNDGPTNASILPGGATPEDLLSTITDGIYIEAFTGGFADTNTGVFSRQARGKMIKNGVVQDNEPVSGFVVAGDLSEMFKDVVLANDTPKLPSTRHSLAAPTTRINKVKIAGK